MSRLVRSLCSVFGLALLLSGWTAQPTGAVVSTPDARPFLLGTIEFRGIPLGGWYDFPEKVAEALDLFALCAQSPAHCPKREVVEILAETAELRHAEPHRVLAAVNRLVNRRP